MPMSTLRGTATIIGPIINVGQRVSRTVTVKGIKPGDVAIVSREDHVPDAVRVWARCTAADTLTVFFFNPSASTVILVDGAVLSYIVFQD